MNPQAQAAPTHKQSQREQWREHVARSTGITLPAAVRGLLFQLYDRMDRDGRCFASNENLARELGLGPKSTTSVKRWIRAAKAVGVLETKETERGREFVAVIPERESNVVPIRPDTASAGGHVGAPSREIPAPNQGHQVGQGGHQVAPKAESKSQGAYKAPLASPSLRSGLAGSSGSSGSSPEGSAADVVDVNEENDDGSLGVKTPVAVKQQGRPKSRRPLEANPHPITSKKGMTLERFFAPASATALASFDAWANAGEQGPPSRDGPPAAKTCPMCDRRTTRPNAEACVFCNFPFSEKWARAKGGRLKGGIE